MNDMIWNGARDPESRGQAARKILYIEDNLSNVSLMEAILEHRPDIDLMTSMQGRLGLDLAREHPPHAIFLDLHLPDMSGLDVLARLRAEPTTRKTPVIVFTADATPGLAERTLATGAHAFFTKPLDAKKLLEIVEELLPLERTSPTGRA